MFLMCIGPWHHIIVYSIDCISFLKGENLPNRVITTTKSLSEILSEIDGHVSTRTLHTWEISAVPIDSHINVPRQSSTTITDGDGLVLHEIYLRSHVFLRGCINGILGSLYTTSKAYCQPHEVGITISNILIELNNWYQGLPLDMQFARSIASLQLSSKPTSLRLVSSSDPNHLRQILSHDHQRELAISYHAAIFTLHRPLLYFVLHEDMEQSAIMPSPPASHQHLEPWVLDNCRSCIESASIIIQLLSPETHSTAYGGTNKSFTPNSASMSDHIESQSTPSSARNTGRLQYESWTTTQLLTVTYAVLIQIQPIAAFAPIFRGSTDIDSLLDRAEATLDSSVVESLGTRRTLEYLRNIRYNSQTLSPMS
jgi:hypothetical protein